MSCKSCQERLIDYYYNELEQPARREVDAHLRECGECAKEYCRLQSDLNGVSDLGRAEPGPLTAEQLRQTVQREFRPSWWRRMLRISLVPIPAYQALMLGLILLAGWVLFSPPPLRFSAPRAERESSEVAAPASERAALWENYDASILLQADPRTL